jgi:hypothetical protein
MAVISSNVAEKAVCWCDGRKKRNRRILRRLTHSAVAGRVIDGVESETAIFLHSNHLQKRMGYPAKFVPDTPYLKREPSNRIDQ